MEKKKLFFQGKPDTVKNTSLWFAAGLLVLWILVFTAYRLGYLS
ncbi:hypothetical protein ABDD95_12720 [Mucilaginibacter sp. PAMB04274]